MIILLIFLAGLVIAFFSLRESEPEDDYMDAERPGPIHPFDTTKN